MVSSQTTTAPNPPTQSSPSRFTQSNAPLLAYRQRPTCRLLKTRTFTRACQPSTQPKSPHRSIQPSGYPSSRVRRQIQWCTPTRLPDWHTCHKHNPPTACQSPAPYAGPPDSARSRVHRSTRRTIPAASQPSTTSLQPPRRPAPLAPDCHDFSVRHWDPIPATTRPTLELQSLTTAR